MARAIVLFLVVVSLAVQTSPTFLSAQTGSTVLRGIITPPNTGFAKFPSLSTYNNRVYLGGNVGDRARLWTKTDSSTSFDGDPIDLGGGSGQDDYQNVATATAQDGTVYTVWNSVRQGVYLRARQPNGTLGPQRTVVSGGAFRVFVDVGVTTDGVIIVTWDGDEQGNARFFATYSRDGGATWSSPQVLVNEQAYRSAARIATGPNGSASIAYFGFPSFNVYVSRWNGNGFTRETVSAGRGDSYQPADPTAAISGLGTYYAAWRTVSGDVYYGERQANGSWGVSRLAGGGGKVVGPVSISADAIDNIHVAWTSDVAGGQPDVYYAFKPADGDWRGPFQQDGQGYAANADVAGSLTDQAYGHVVFERFVGSDMSNRYLLWATPSRGGSTVNADPVINNDAASTKSRSLTITFKDIQGDPKEIRWRWNEFPTDAANDSGGWKPYTNPLTVSVPDRVTTSDCENLTLHLQSRNGDVIGPVIENDSIVYDAAVQVVAEVRNPHMTGETTTYNQGASTGAANYTRDAGIDILLSNVGDCVGLKKYKIGNLAEEDWNPNYVTSKRRYMFNPTQGSVLTTSAYATDNLDNRADFTLPFIYDARSNGQPQYRSGTFAVDNATTNTSILRTLTFSNVEVTDTVYQGTAGKPFWGVWIATSKGQPVSDPNDTTLQWTPIRVDNPGNSFSVEYNLFSGLNLSSGTGQAGKYYLYAKFLDGAGNPSAQTIGPIEFDLPENYQLIKVNLPTISQ